MYVCLFVCLSVCSLITRGRKERLSQKFLGVASGRLVNGFRRKNCRGSWVGDKNWHFSFIAAPVGKALLGSPNL